MYGPSPHRRQSITPQPAHPRPPLGSLGMSRHRGSVKLFGPQQPRTAEVVVVGLPVVVGGVGPGDVVGPPPAPGLVAIHQRVLDLVLPSSYLASWSASWYAAWGSMMAWAITT